MSADSRLQAPGCSFQAPSSSSQAPDSRFQTPGSRFPAPDSRFQTPGSGFQAPGSRFQSPDCRFQAPPHHLLHPMVGALQASESRFAPSQRCWDYKQQRLSSHKHTIQSEAQPRQLAVVLQARSRFPKGGGCWHVVLPPSMGPHFLKAAVYLCCY